MEKPVSYLQTDPRWAKMPYAANGESSTIGQAGCGPASMAMAVSTFTKTKLTPDQACAWSLEKGFKALGQGTYYSYFPAAGKHYGAETTQLTPSDLRSMAAGKARAYHDAALGAVAAGNLVIVCMGKGLWTASGHFILWYACDGTSVYINDPNSESPERTKNTLQRLQGEAKHYFIVKRPLEASLTPEKAMETVKAAAGLSDETIEFLARDYKYGDALIVKLAAAIGMAKGAGAGTTGIAEARALVQKRAGLDNNTMAYLAAYAYGDPLIAKLAAAMA